ncbi:MAG TPA: hypothetical protein VF017_14075 [Thermoanaerobaculia bacterium]|nr:hypothetical protein [Thermoanaerobaculia bacterium]
MTPTPPVVLRDFEPADAAKLCRLLATTFREEYAQQGLDVMKFERMYWLMGWANRFLSPLRLDFFRITVAVEGELLLGALTSFRAGPRAWYQGFGVMAPESRGRGLYKQIIRHTLDGVLARGGHIAGGEIRPDNTPALRPYRDYFGTEVLPARHVHLVALDSVREPERRLDLEEISARRFAGLPEAAALRQEMRGGFLLEGEVRRGLLACLLGRLLPPLTARSWGLFEGGQLRAFVRVRTHWPARIQALDVISFAPDLPLATTRDVLRTLLVRLRCQTSAPIRLYLDPGEPRLESLAREEGWPLLAPLHPIRTDVARAVARTNQDGSLRDQPEAAAKGAA